MPQSRTQGGDLFIVDNSDSDWKARQYLHEWCAIARARKVPMTEEHRGPSIRPHIRSLGPRL